MFDYEKVIPAAIPMKRADISTTRNPFNCMPSIYTDNIYKDSYKESAAYRAKIAEDRKRLGLD